MGECFSSSEIHTQLIIDMYDTQEMLQNMSDFWKREDSDTYREHKLTLVRWASNRMVKNTSQSLSGHYAGSPRAPCGRTHMGPIVCRGTSLRGALNDFT